MKIVVVYGGRGLIDDPALYVLEKIQEVLEELRVQVNRINLYEQKNAISTLPSELKDADGVVLGVSLEWYGIGGMMQEFLDACWLYADKEKLKSLYMMPVVIATTAGEKNAKLFLEEAWELLGGYSVEGICAYVENHVNFEMDKNYAKLIEKRAEDLYRVINQKRVVMPSSLAVLSGSMVKAPGLELTPQESEQLSKIVSDDTYVKQQTEDIEELSEMFKGMLKEKEEKQETQNHPDTKEQSDNFSRKFGKRKNGAEDTLSQEKQQTEPEPDTEELINSLRNLAHNITASNLSQTINDKKEEPFSYPVDYAEKLKSSFQPQKDFSAVYSFHITDKDQILKVSVQNEKLDVRYANQEEGDVLMQIDSAVLNRIFAAKATFYDSFMSGDIVVKGNFKTLRMLDEIFVFRMGR